MQLIRAMVIQQDSFWSVLYTDNEFLYWKIVYGSTGALESFIKANKPASTAGFLSTAVSLYFLS